MSVVFQDSLSLARLPGKRSANGRALNCSSCRSGGVPAALLELPGKMTLFRKDYVNAALSCLSGCAACVNIHSHFLPGLVRSMTASGWDGSNSAACAAVGTGSVPPAAEERVTTLGCLLATSLSRHQCRGQPLLGSPAAMAQQRLRRVASTWPRRRGPAATALDPTSIPHMEPAVVPLVLRWAPSVRCELCSPDSSDCRWPAL